ncbi:MAG: lipoyl synthase [Pseudomonadota bacterium]|nr:lipoyl synthase [Pseudomonadota bacterium]
MNVKGSIKKIDTKTESGHKYRNEFGIIAVKDGIKSRKLDQIPIISKPSWLKAKLPSGVDFSRVRSIVSQHRLSTVCEESKCPNIGECWNAGTATIMLMGNVCTRACRFCAVDTGNPNGWLDPMEPKNTAQSVSLMKLGYVVLTSVDRDDLIDGGASHYADCIAAVKKLNPNTLVEALTPDFEGKFENVSTVINSGLDVFAQNIETVERLTELVRDPRASYQRTMNVLSMAKKMAPDILVKTSLMLGFGEKQEEVLRTMDQLRENQVDILTLGQYLQPTINHLPVEEFISPEAFDWFRDEGIKRGFMEVVSGPMVRSSYRADRVFEKSNVGLISRN